MQIPWTQDPARALGFPDFSPSPPPCRADQKAGASAVGRRSGQVLRAGGRAVSLRGEAGLLGLQGTGAVRAASVCLGIGVIFPWSETETITGHMLLSLPGGLREWKVGKVVSVHFIGCHRWTAGFIGLKGFYAAIAATVIAGGESYTLMISLVPSQNTTCEIKTRSTHLPFGSPPV